MSFVTLFGKQRAGRDDNRGVVGGDPDDLRVLPGVVDRNWACPQGRSIPLLPRTSPRLPRRTVGSPVHPESVCSSLCTRFWRRNLAFPDASSITFIHRSSSRSLSGING